MAFEANEPEFKSPLSLTYYRTWASLLTGLCFDFLIHKTNIIVVPIDNRIIMKIK